MLFIPSYTLLEPGPILGPAAPEKFFYLMDRNLPRNIIIIIIIIISQYKTLECCPHYE